MLRNPDSVAAIILAGGRGSRLVPAAREFEKPLYPVGGRPLIEYAAEFADTFGVRHTVIVTNPSIDDRIKVGPRASKVVQEEPHGVVDAVRIGLSAIDLAITPWTMILCSDNTFTPGGRWFREAWQAQEPRDIGYFGARYTADPEGRFTTLGIDGKFKPRFSDPAICIRWVGPVLISTLGLWAGVADAEAPEHMFNAAARFMAPILMACDDHGIAE